MAIHILNQLCLICNKEIKDDDHYFSFPPFIQNIKDPLYKFNDSTFHIKCLERDTYGRKAIVFANEWIDKTRPDNRICIVSGNQITKMEDYIFIDLLTSDENHVLFNFRFLTIYKNNLSEWNNRTEFVENATRFLKKYKLGEFNYLSKLVELMNNG